MSFHNWQALNDSVKTVSDDFSLVKILKKNIVICLRNPSDAFVHLFAVNALGSEGQEGTHAGGTESRKPCHLPSRGAPL